MVAVLKASPVIIDELAPNDRSSEPTLEARRRAFYSVALEVSLLVSCFVFVVCSAQADMSRRTHAAPGAQQTKHPGEPAPLIAPPADNSEKSLATVG